MTAAGGNRVGIATVVLLGFALVNSQALAGVSTVTPTRTPTNTATSTPTSCAGAPPVVEPVTSPTGEATAEIVFCARIVGSSFASVCGPAGCATSIEFGSGCSPCSTGSCNRAVVPLLPNQSNLIQVCQGNSLCAAGGCVVADRNGAALSIEQIAATPTATATATKTPCLGLDVDDNGFVQGATDGVYIFRRLLGLGFVVPAPFRALDPSIPPDATIAANIDALGSGLDVDGNGQVLGNTDGVYVFRYLMNLATLVPTPFRTLDPAILEDAAIATNIAALCDASGTTSPRR